MLLARRRWAAGAVVRAGWCSLDRGYKIGAGELRKTMVMTGAAIGKDASLILKVTEVEHHHKGRGGGSVLAKLRDIQGSTAYSHRFGGSESIELAELEPADNPFQFLFREGSMVHLMDMTSFEELELSDDIFGDQLVWLQEGMDIKVTRVNGVPVLAALPMKAEFEVVETIPRPKDTKVETSKPGKLSNGVTIKVPIFVEAGDTIVVNIEKGGEFASRPIR